MFGSPKLYFYCEHLSRFVVAMNRVDREREKHILLLGLFSSHIRKAHVSI